MRRLFSTILLLVALVLCPALLRGEEHTFVLDPQRTVLSFVLGATGHDVHGLLHATGGELRFDTGKGTASGDLMLDARRTETGNVKRDKTMHKKVLESETHPMIVFHAERVEGELATSGKSELDLIGTVELLGAAHELTLHVAASIENGEVSATVTCDVPFVDWGLHDPSAFVLRVAKVVQVSIDAHGSLDAAPVHTASH
jgi:hypothetical protein